MPPYEKHLIEETAKMTEENNKILRGIQRNQRFSRIFTLIKWVIIVAITLGAYYYVQPYLEPVLKLYGNIGSILPNIGDIGGLPGL